MNTIIIENVDNKTTEIITALVKRLGLTVETKTEEDSAEKEASKKEIISNIKEGFKEMDLIKKGNLKTTALNDFLNEL